MRSTTKLAPCSDEEADPAKRTSASTRTRGLAIAMNFRKVLGTFFPQRLQQFLSA